MHQTQLKIGIKNFIWHLSGDCVSLDPVLFNHLALKEISWWFRSTRNHCPWSLHLSYLSNLVCKGKKIPLGRPGHKKDFLRQLFFSNLPESRHGCSRLLLKPKIRNAQEDMVSFYLGTFKITFCTVATITWFSVDSLVQQGFFPFDFFFILKVAFTQLQFQILNKWYKHFTAAQVTCICGLGQTDLFNCLLHNSPRNLFIADLTANFLTDNQKTYWQIATTVSPKPLYSSFCPCN